LADISAGMLEVGVKKSQIKPVKTIEMVLGDSENMPFDDYFDAITVAFGVETLKT
jgi:demethylmenaquinone methyltransferase/2-methoxy-6-polyprenyl-1,4-benzoquinol methylase